MRLIAISLALALTGCGIVGDPPPARDGEEGQAGSINCTLDYRQCEPGQKR